MFFFILFSIEVWGTFKINERFTKDLLNSSSAVYSKYTTGIEIQVSNFSLLYKKLLAKHKLFLIQHGYLTNILNYSFSVVIT